METKYFVLKKLKSITLYFFVIIVNNQITQAQEDTISVVTKKTASNLEEKNKAISFSLKEQDFSYEALNKMEDEELLALFNKVDQDSIKAEKVASTYLNRAKKAKDTIKMARGYERLARIFHHEKNIQFTDSIIYLTKDSNNITYPAIGYILRGYEYYRIGEVEKGTANYFIAYEIALKKNNITQKLYLLNKLLYLKAIWGNKKDALKLQFERHKLLISKDYINNVKKASRKALHSDLQETFVIEQLTSLQNFVFCYLNLKKLDSARIYLDKGLILSEKNKNKNRVSILYNWFLESSIEIDFYDKNFKGSIHTCDSLLLKVDIKRNLHSTQNINLFKGLSLLKLNEYEEGIVYLKRSDSIFEANNFSVSQPYQRILFEQLLNYYQLKNDTEQKIKYLNKLIAADSIIIKNYKYFEPNLIREFETPQLINEKEQLIAKLEQNNHVKSIQIGWVIGTLSLCLLILGYYINKQQLYKKRFNSLLSQNGSKNKAKKGERSRNEISKEIYNSILEHLDTFEEENKYLSTKISLQDMAKSFKTNYNYLSRVININKGKRFSCYINDLRVEFAFNELKRNQKLRNFTLKAIAKECGFKSAESFSKSFIKIYGFSPSFYLKQLDKKD